MKKAVIFTLLCLVLFCGSGCGLPINWKELSDTTALSEYQEELSKTPQIQVISADSSEVLQTLKTEKELENFDLALNIEKWKLTELPENVRQTGTFLFSQKETLKFGQNAADRTQKEVVRICSYENTSYENASYITLQVLGVPLHFEVPEETGNYLNSYFNRPKNQ